MRARMATPTVPFRAYITQAQHVFPPRAACCSVAKFQSCSVGPFTDAIVPNPCTMSTTADHDDVQSDSPAATDHSSDLASISDRLADLERALSTVPTTTAPPAPSLPSSTAIQGRPRSGPYFFSCIPLYCRSNSLY